MAFGKKKRRITCITLTDMAGNCAYEGRIDALTVPYPVIQELSILYFNDPEPCYIHQGAVLSRIFGELEHALNEDRTYKIVELPAQMHKYFSHYRAEKVRLTHREV